MANSGPHTTLRPDLLVPLDVAYTHVRMLVEQDYTPEERQRVGAIALNAIGEVRLDLFQRYMDEATSDE